MNRSRQPKGAPASTGGQFSAETRGGPVKLADPAASPVSGAVKWEYYEDERTDFPVIVGETEMDIEAVLDTYDLDELMDEDGEAYEIDNDTWSDFVLSRGQELGLISDHPLAGARGASFGFQADQEELQRYVDLRRATGRTDALQVTPEAQLARAQAVVSEAYGEIGRVKEKVERGHLVRARILAEQDGVQVARIERSTLNEYAAWGYRAFEADDRPVEVDDVSMLHEELLQLVNVDAGDDHNRFRITP